MRVPADVRFTVPDLETLARLTSAALPLGLRATPSVRGFHRDVYFDTPDAELRRRRVTCRLRLTLDDRRFLTVGLDAPAGGGPPRESTAAIDDTDAARILHGASGPARRLQAIVAPERLQPVLELVTERAQRRGRGRLPLGGFAFLYDAVTVRGREQQGAFQELVVRRLGWTRLTLAALARAIEDAYALRPTLTGRRARAELALDALEAEGLVRDVHAPHLVALLAVDGGRVALAGDATGLRLPVRPGSGEAACREVMRAALGNAEGQVALLGVVPGTPTRPALEVWLARRLRRDLGADGDADLQWFPAAEIVQRAGSPGLRDATTLAALTLAARSELLPEWSAPAAADAEPHPTDDGARHTLARLRTPVLVDRAVHVATMAPDHFLNPELSWLEFNARVLALAEDSSTPLLGRLRFLSIVSTNLDEFFKVRVAGVKRAVAAGVSAPSLDGLTPREHLDAIALRVRALVARQYRCLRQLAEHDLPSRGIRLRRWDELAPREQERLRAHFERELFPAVTPRAITWAPGHPFPLIEELRLSLAVTIRDDRTGTRHFAHLEIPDALPRFVPLEGEHDVVPVEDVIRAHLDAFYPGRTVLAAHVFRLTRRGELDLDEPAAADFVQAVEEELRRRPVAPVVRIEVERAMPQAVREILFKELRFEDPSQAAVLGDPDVYEAEGPVDLGDLRELASLPRPELHFPAFVPAQPFPADRPTFDLIEERDRLVHHPYDAFEHTFEAFIRAAADDPDVLAIKLTLYRPGGPSAVGDALYRAAAGGKDVSVFVELKARFDEERNIRWVRALERQGIHVVTGLVRLKTHAKIALVVRRVAGGIRRYAHISTGNYNRETAHQYTDIGLFTTDESITADVHALFNELTGSSREPDVDFRTLLVSPTNMLPRFLALIEQEITNASRGDPAQIRAKLNALSDAEIIAALYRASQAGVYVDMVVRGICTLRPGIPGLSERIRVVSVLGRFLEHARIFHFENAGVPEFYLGSADWRPRNLRRRLEVVTPVREPAARARLARILDAELDDPFAWELRADGTYARVVPPTGVELEHAQERFLRETTT